MSTRFGRHVAPPPRGLAANAVAFSLRQSRDLFLSVAIAALLSLRSHPQHALLERAQVPRMMTGTVLAVPMMAMVKAIANHLPPLQPAARLLKE